MAVPVKSAAQSPLFALQGELGEAATRLRALQGEMQALCNKTEELGRKLKSAKNDMYQAQKDCQVGLGKAVLLVFFFLCVAWWLCMILPPSRKFKNLPLSLHFAS